MAKTKGKDTPTPFKQLTPACNHIEEKPEFTGLARTMRCYRNNGHPDFQVLTLHIVKGKVMTIEVSDAYKSFEASDRMDLWNDISALNLNSKWEEGKTFSK